MEGKPRTTTIAIIAVLCLIAAAIDLVPLYGTPAFAPAAGWSALLWPIIGFTCYGFVEITYLLLQPTGMPMPWVDLSKRTGKK